jgi:hypothetical protein
MLVIRDSQMAVFDERRKSAFADSSVAHVRRHLPDDFERLGEAGVRQLVLDAIDKGKPYGLARKSEVSGILLLMVARGADFDKGEAHAWIRNILSNSFLANDSKIGMIFDRWGAQIEEEARSVESELAALDRELDAAETGDQEEGD